MFIQATQILHQTLAALESHQPLGKVTGLVFEPANGRLLALVVQTHGWFSQKQFLAASDMCSVESGVVLTRAESDLVALKDLPRADEALKSRIRVLHQRAFTESGQRLGEVADVLLETDSWQITKYYLRNLLAERILLAEDVHSITKKGVIFFDRVNEPGGTAPAAEAAAA